MVIQTNVIPNENINSILGYTDEPYCYDTRKTDKGRIDLCAHLDYLFYAEFVAASLCFLLCPRSFGRTDFKQTQPHTQKPNRP